MLSGIQAVRAPDLQLLPLLLVSLCVFGWSRPAAGDTIAILPMTSTTRALQIYQTATSTALAKELDAALASSVSSVSSAADVPKDTRVIIDGRLIAATQDRVKLEAHVRQASTGKSVATYATAFAATTEIDTLVHELAAKLAPAITRALTPAAPIRLPPTIVRGAGVAQELRLDSQDHLLGHSESPEPDILLLPPTGKAADGVVSVVRPATSGALDMMARLGLRAATTDTLARLDVGAIVAKLSESGARYALMVQVRDVSFSYNAVLSARGHVRVLVMGRDGLPVLDKTVRTDTVVGSRGDKHQALVYQVVEQALDMLLPQFRIVAQQAKDRNAVDAASKERSAQR
jgi:hypothetical protein